MLTDKEKEIAREVAAEYTRSGMTLADSYSLFLSRIREEQEAVLYQCTGCGRVTESIDDDWNVLKLGGFRSCCPERDMRPLFTIPLAAPDCSELVEALERIARHECGDDFHQVIAERALANHAKRMKGDE